MQIEVYTDGSATVATKPGGYGYVVVIDGQKYSEGSGHMERASNNDAELEAAIQGLKKVNDYIELHTYLEHFSNPKIEYDITLVSDSQLILGWATGKYAFRQEDKLEKFKQFQLLIKLMDVQTRWVEGHSGDEHNERCDKLANEARLNVQKEQDKIEALTTGKTLIGTKKSSTICVWHKDVLKIIDLDQNVIEDYNREIHGTRGSMLEIREEKSR